MWNWHDGKMALEYLFCAGGSPPPRGSTSSGCYDLPERVLPPDVLGAPTPRRRTRSASWSGSRPARSAWPPSPTCATTSGCRRPTSKAAVAELVEAGELLPVAVEGWAAPAYLWHDARRPRRVAARALLSPFDSLIWFRERTERLFGFRYRIEIYTPGAEAACTATTCCRSCSARRWSARVDLKSDRQAGVLRVPGAWLESDEDRDHVAGELADELAITAAWLGLDGVVVMPRGDLAGALRAAAP